MFNSVVRFTNTNFLISKSNTMLLPFVGIVSSRRLQRMVTT